MDLALQAGAACATAKLSSVHLRVSFTHFHDERCATTLSLTHRVTWGGSKLLGGHHDLVVVLPFFFDHEVFKTAGTEQVE